jgi:hypothetical protein
VRIELLLDHSLRPRLLARRLVLRLKLNLAGLADPDDRNVLYSLYNPKIALGHSYSLPQFRLSGVGRAPSPAAFAFELAWK